MNHQHFTCQKFIHTKSITYDYKLILDWRAVKKHDTEKHHSIIVPVWSKQLKMEQLE